jgi:hypothetical protein
MHAKIVWNLSRRAALERYLFVRHSVRRSYINPNVTARIVEP